MTSEDAGKDLVSLQKLMKKLWLAHADVQANEDRIKDTNTHAASLVESDQFDIVFQEKRKSINERYEHIRNFTANRQAHLNQALRHHHRSRPEPQRKTRELDIRVRWHGRVEESILFFTSARRGGVLSFVDVSVIRLLSLSFELCLCSCTVVVAPVCRGIKGRHGVK